MNRFNSEFKQDNHARLRDKNETNRLGIDHRSRLFGACRRRRQRPKRQRRRYGSMREAIPVQRRAAGQRLGQAVLEKYKDTPSAGYELDLLRVNQRFPAPEYLRLAATGEGR